MSKYMFNLEKYNEEKANDETKEKISNAVSKISDFRKKIYLNRPFTQQDYEILIKCDSQLIIDADEYALKIISSINTVIKSQNVISILQIMLMNSQKRRWTLKDITNKLTSKAKTGKIQEALNSEFFIYNEKKRNYCINITNLINAFK